MTASRYSVQKTSPEFSVDASTRWHAVETATGEVAVYGSSRGEVRQWIKDQAPAAPVGKPLNVVEVTGDELTVDEQAFESDEERFGAQDSDVDLDAQLIEALDAAFETSVEAEVTEPTVYVPPAEVAVTEEFFDGDQAPAEEEALTDEQCAELDAEGVVTITDEQAKWLAKAEEKIPGTEPKRRGSKGTSTPRVKATGPCVKCGKDTDRIVKGMCQPCYHASRRPERVEGTGTRKAGGKLTEEIVRQMFVLRAQGLTLRQIGERYDVTGPTVSGIMTGKTWTSVPRLTETEAAV